MCTSRNEVMIRLSQLSEDFCVWTLVRRKEKKWLNITFFTTYEAWHGEPPEFISSKDELLQLRMKK